MAADDDILAQALSLHRDGVHAEAEALYLRLLAADPLNVQALYLLGLLSHQLERHQGALALLGRAAALAPEQADIHCHIGEAARALGRPSEAGRAYRRALALDPAAAKAHYGLGIALKELARLPEALACLCRAARLDPAVPRYRMAKGRMEQLLGRFATGVALCEARLEMPAYHAQLAALPACPLWDGQPVDSLLVLAEGGLGDVLQFARYIPLLAARCRRLLLAFPPVLGHLMAQFSGWERWDGAARPQALAPLLSLPHHFRHDLATLPAAVPYFAAEPERVARWAARLARRPGETLIGVAWRAGPETWIEGEAGRGFDPMLLAPLARLPGVRLVALQKGEPPPEALGAQGLGADFDAGPDAFRDAAAVMARLDLVVTPDTALAHLAGALARPAFVALKAVPECRWLMDRADSPWYPTLRLFRQPAPGEWAAVFEAMAAQIMPWLRKDQ